MKNIILNKTYLVVFSFLIIFSSPSFAWSNYFRFVNNFNVPLMVSITPSFANVSNLCGGAINNVEVASKSTSCEFEFEAEKKNWYSIPENNGTITISRKDDANSYCVYQYDYSYTLIPYSYFNIHSENISLKSCHGQLRSKEISVVNLHNEALPRSLVGTIGKEVTESLSVADCGGQGGNNCLIASPDLNTVYKSGGSSLAQSLVLQSKLDRYEPLNFEQFIGSHNSAISTHYTTSTKGSNLSYSDPDSYLTLTEQLNSGVRQLELDIMWVKDRVMLCHTNKGVDPSGDMCEGNYPLTAALTEIKTWVEKNPDALILLYLDAHAPLSGHVADLDANLSQLESQSFTPAIANQYFHVEENMLPAFQLTQDALINQFKKNIIITNDDDIDNLKTSRYVFVSVQNSHATPLTENGVDTFFASNHSSCVDQSKYANIKAVFDEDPDHYNLLRLNSARTTINYVSSVKGRSPDQYIDYFTTANLSMLLNCPVNIFSTSMLGFTCDSNNCDAHPTDPKLYSFLWSWSLGYPLNSGSEIAYINPHTNHFENDELVPGHVYSVLCYKKDGKQVTPIAPLRWYLNTVTLKDPSSAFNIAQSSCSNSGGVFAVPTVSYWMHDVVSIINSKEMNVLVNYIKEKGQWIPNQYRDVGVD